MKKAAFIFLFLQKHAGSWDLPDRDSPDLTKLDNTLQGRDARSARKYNMNHTVGWFVLRGFSVTHLLINVSPDTDPRQIVRRGHGGQYQGGSERFCFFISLTKKSVKTGSPNRPALSLNLTFRGICKNRVFKVPID